MQIGEDLLHACIRLEGPALFNADGRHHAFDLRSEIIFGFTLNEIMEFFEERVVVWQDGVHLFGG